MTKIQLIYLSEGPHHTSKSGRKVRTVIVQCRCGKHFKMLKHNFKKKPFSSCGCYQKERSDLHGLLGTNIYRRWASMIQRCHNPKSINYCHYGARGIFVCDEWRDFKRFKKWADISGFKSSLQIDRIDNYKGYSPDNCRWVTRSENNRNKRGNVLVTYNEQTKTLAEWGEITGINQKTLSDRIKKGWTPEKALTELKYIKTKP